MSEQDKKFEDLLRANRPAIPAVPPAEFEALLERVSPRTRWYVYGLKSGLAVATLALILTWQSTAPMKTAPDPELDALLNEAAIEMFEPGVGSDDWDLYAAL